MLARVQNGVQLVVPRIVEGDDVFFDGGLVPGHEAAPWWGEDIDSENDHGIKNVRHQGL